MKSFCGSQERIQKGIVMETQISRNSRDWLWVTASAAVDSCTLLSELTVAVEWWIQMLILNTSLSLLVHWGVTFLVKLLELFLWFLVIIKIKLKRKDHLVCCFLLVLFSGWAFPKSSSMGSMWGWWHQAALSSPSAAGICVLSVRTETGSASHVWDQGWAHTCVCTLMPSPGICWSSVLCCHWEYTWNKVGLWRLLWHWFSSLSMMCLAPEREKTDACLFFYYLWGGSFEWLPKSWGSCMLCCLLIPWL